MFPLRFLGLFPLLAALLAVAQYQSPVPPGALGPAAQTGSTIEPVSPQAVSREASITAAELQIPVRIREIALRAEAALVKHDAKQAERLADRALREEPGCARALVVMAILRVDQGNLKDGFAWLERAIAADREYPRAYVALGAAYNLSHEYAAAENTLGTALHLAPSLWQAHLEMSKALLGITKYEEGLHELARTQELQHQRSPETCLLKGWALMKLKRYGESRTELKEFLRLAPESPQAQTAGHWLAQMPEGGEIASGK